jgi:PIN domain nuclease of toxin-antitoxin system
LVECAGQPSRRRRQGRYSGPWQPGRGKRRQRWEIAIKRKTGKLSFRHDVLPAIAADGFETIDITAEHADRAGSLPLHHADPFDRLLVAQARIEQFVLVTQDRQLLPYGVPLIGVT